MKLHHLRDLLAVAEKGSVRAAAKHLGIGQPALSRSLRGLEREVGTQLLERHARGATLTKLGATFASRSGVAVQELRRALDELTQLQGGARGKVVTCLSSLSHIALLPTALAPFRTRYPDVELRIIEGVYPVIERRLLDGTIDFYVGPLPSHGAAAGLRHDKLFETPRIVLARPAHPLRNATSLTQLIGADWITTSITDDPRSEFDDLFLRHGLPPPRLALRAESMLTWLTALSSTDMLAISPAGFVDSPLLNNQLTQISVREQLSGPTISLVQRAALPLTPAAEHLADLLRRSVPQLQAA